MVQWVKMMKAIYLHLMIVIQKLESIMIHQSKFYTSLLIRYVTVKWNSKHKNLTCGWLISEVMRHLLFEDEFNKKTHIIGMKNMNYNTSEVYDYLLTQLESTLHFIKDGDSLQIISKY